VGERCGWILSRLARGVDEARAAHGQAGRWPDPDDRFPDEPDGELFAFRYRSRTGVVGGGELRCGLRTIPIWMPGVGGGAGEWRVTRRALLEAWGIGGVGMRAVLTSAELAGFVRRLVEEAEGCLGEGELGRNPVEGAGSRERR
jgi:hypothetical protein